MTTGLGSSGGGAAGADALLFQGPDNSVGVRATYLLEEENKANRTVPRLFIPLHRGARFFYERHRYDQWLTIPVLLAVLALLIRFFGGL